MIDYNNNKIPISNEQIIQLINIANLQRNFSYVPYSNFSTGAALLTIDDKIYTGCNIENAAYGPSNCAERTALFNAISKGDKQFKAIAVVGGKINENISDYCPPCGVCRQVMIEFCDKDTFYIILAKSLDEIKIFSLSQLMPMSFSNVYI